MGADMAKKQKLGESEEDNTSIDEKLVLSIEKLQEVQDELEKINEEASEKVLEVEQKFNVVRKPVYDRRNEIIKSIPDFWFTAFLNHPALFELWTNEDQKIMMFLANLDVEDIKDVKSGYSITLEFMPNPYFENTKLTKTFVLLEEATTKITSTPIKWKEGMGISNGATEGDQEKKRSHSEESFFTWFSEGEYKLNLDEIRDEIADIIKDDIWQNPLAYFNHETGSDDSEADEDDDDV